MTLPLRPLGQTGIHVSCLGLGTVKFGRNQQVKYPMSFSLPEDKEVRALLDQAQAAGINLIDTAPAYGSSEQRLGRLLQARDKWIICSKVGEEFIDGKSIFNFSGEHTRQRVERSLRDLKTDYLDVVLIHSDGRDEEILDHTDCLATLLKLKQQGLVRAIGMSSKTASGGLKAVALTDVVMVTYNLTQQDDVSVIDAARAANKGVMVKKALDSGHAAIGTANGATESLQFVLRRQGVSTVIIGTLNPAHLAANVAAAALVRY